MKIAIAYDNGEIHGHFGHCDMFALYNYPVDDPEQVTKVLLPSEGRSGHQAMAELMRDNKVDVVLCGNMGQEAKSLLLSWGIVPITGYCGSADVAAELLIRGQLPPAEEGGCSGGCGGCGGGCHSGDEGCGCGGDDEGCGCHGGW